MCGIVGYIASGDRVHPESRQHFLRYALSMNTIRGEDSTGIISVYDGRGFDVRTARSLAPGDKYIHTKQWDNISRDGWCTIGHGRAATIGDVKLSNAHPFRFGPITLVHNGTLEKNGSSLPTYDKYLDVDSMQIALALSEAAPGEADDVLSLVDGAMALVWTDDRDKTVNMARNGARPLHFTFNKAKNFMMFMSDGHQLLSVNKSLWKTTAQGESIYSLDTYKHLKWHYGDLVPEVTGFDPFPVYSPPAAAAVITPTPPRLGLNGINKTNANHGGKERADLRARAAERKRIRNGLGASGGRMGKALAPMTAALAKLYELDPSMMMRFALEDRYELSANIEMVHGTLYLQHWGNTPWPAVIYNVPAQQASAFSEKDWMVKPIGITRPIAGMGDSPSILCQLIHCDWAGYTNKDGSVNRVKGPDGRLISGWKLDRMVEAGCANCANNLSMHDMDRYAYANKDHDLICEDCKWSNCK